MIKILVVDDEEHMRWLLQKALQQEGYQVQTAANGQEALSFFREEQFDLMLLDLRLPDLDGLEVLEKLPQRKGCPVIILTAYATVETAIKAMKLGAADYITKPFELEELKLQVKKALHLQELENRVSFLEQELDRNSQSSELIGASKAIKDIKDKIASVAASSATVLLTGESGTGKEIAARMLHRQSGREKLMVAVNCAAMPENLLESELFGYEKGAFSGADRRHPGKFELADGATLFLDEIAEMPLPMQSKLLRVIQEKQFYRLGGSSIVQVNVRIIAATNQDLSKSLAEGSFRQDLFYRLNVFPIHLPPLRDRVEDIPLLAEHFLRLFDPKGRISGFSREALLAMQHYSWPGNIRELENVVERAVMICRKGQIDTGLLLLREEPQAPAGNLQLPPGGVKLDEVEKNLIAQALEKTAGNQTRAAKLLGITRSALIYRMEKHGLQ